MTAGDGLTVRDASVEVSDVDRVFRVEIEALDLPPGGVIALSGASGSGKTLILEMLGLLRPPSDETLYAAAGRDLAALWLNAAGGDGLARMRAELFGFVPQTGGLLPFLDVADNIALPQRICDRLDPGWCAALMDRLGLADLRGLLPDALSIGQRQRVAIARALAHRPAFVIADEPTAALDAHSADQVLELLLETARETGAGLVLSSHDTERITRFGIGIRRLAPAGGRSFVSRLEAA
ncbi:MAG: ABC transporter ATP-binding protein [Paracoccaceae bacterium]